MYRLLMVSSLILLSLGLKALSPVNDSTDISEEEAYRFIDSVKRSEKFQTGLISLPGGKAEVNVPEGFKFLNAEQSKYVLTTLWGNPPESSADILGMIFPENSDPFTDNSYAFIVSYEDIGYVKDDDAEKINYSEMLTNLQKEEKETNEARQKLGYQPIHMVGWAAQPYYDKDKKVLHWAKELQFGSDEPHTLNYEIRILGRHGIISLNAVCTMEELLLVQGNINRILPMAKFTEGNSYFDFDPKVDKVAAWTIGGLVAGKLLAKVGFFAVLVKYAAVLWKFILLGLAAVAGYFRKIFIRRKDSGIEKG